MNHVDYIAARTEREPRFADERAVAAAELEMNGFLEQRREALKIPLHRLAEMTHITQERLEAIAEGETMTLREALWLCHELRLSVLIGHEFEIRPIPMVTVTILSGAVTISRLTVGHVPEQSTVRHEALTAGMFSGTQLTYAPTH